jgi:hypothetical protein
MSKIMKTLSRWIILMACAYLLQQCEDTSSPAVKFDDATTSAAKNDPFVLYAIPWNEPPYTFMIELFGKVGSTISVDWGDGTSSGLTFDQANGSLEKSYEAPGRYKVTFSGDTRDITFVKSSYGAGVFDSINVSSLRNLAGIRIGLTHGPELFDLSANRNLTEVSFTNVIELSDIILPKNHRINSLSIAGPNQLGTAVVDRVIKSVYDNAVKWSIYNGYINVQKVFYLYEGDEGYLDLVGPPSPESVVMLKELRDVYGWELVPPI